MALKRRFGHPDGAKLALERRFGRHGSAKLALERRFGRPGRAKLALERRFGRPCKPSNEKKAFPLFARPEAPTENLWIDVFLQKQGSTYPLGEKILESICVGI